MSRKGDRGWEKVSKYEIKRWRERETGTETKG